MCKFVTIANLSYSFGNKKKIHKFVFSPSALFSIWFLCWGKMLRIAAAQTLHQTRLVGPAFRLGDRKCLPIVHARRSALEELQDEKESESVPGGGGHIQSDVGNC